MKFFDRFRRRRTRYCHFHAYNTITGEVHGYLVGESFEDLTLDLASFVPDFPILLEGTGFDLTAVIRDKPRRKGWEIVYLDRVIGEGEYK